MTKNYYEELGIARTANSEEIKKAYRKLARKYHPDVSQEKDAESKMQAINIAYDTLSDPEKKKNYDLELDRPNSYSQGFENTEFSTQNNNFQGFEDLFGRFGKGFGGGYSRAYDQNHHSHQSAYRGEDQHASLEVDLNVAFEGTTQTVTLQIPTYNDVGLPEVQRKTLQIKIPKGMKQGQQIRLTGQGQSGINGGEAGDLYIEIRYRLPEGIRIEAADIFYNINISPWEAALGQDIEITTPSGKLKVNIPKNTIYGKQLRVKDKGIPSKIPGHLYLILNIVYPHADTPKQEQAYREYAASFSNFNPRE